MMRPSKRKKNTIDANNDDDADGWRNVKGKKDAKKNRKRNVPLIKVTYNRRKNRCELLRQFLRGCQFAFKLGGDLASGNFGSGLGLALGLDGCLGGTFCSRLCHCTQLETSLYLNQRTWCHTALERLSHCVDRQHKKGKRARKSGRIPVSVKSIFVTVWFNAHEIYHDELCNRDILSPTNRWWLVVSCPHAHAIQKLPRWFWPSKSCDNCGHCVVVDFCGNPEMCYRNIPWLIFFTAAGRGTRLPALIVNTGVHWFRFGKIFEVFILFYFIVLPCECHGLDRFLVKCGVLAHWFIKTTAPLRANEPEILYRFI